MTVHDRQINPRVILLSDGKATDHRIFEGQDMLQPNGLSWEMVNFLILKKIVNFMRESFKENTFFLCGICINNSLITVFKQPFCYSVDLMLEN